jgi:hypothetical protein
MRDARRTSLLVVVWGLSVAPVGAQPLGSFSWQLQPYCNVVTVTATQVGSAYTLDGFDDQCGAAQRAPVTGLASPNPDGTIGFGLTIVAAPSGAPVHAAARISLATLSGTWNDSTGAGGAFAFGARTGGSPRPPAALGGALLVPGSVGAAQVNTSEVQARVVGQCAAGQFVTRVNANGSLDCGSPATSPDDYAGAVRSVPIAASLIPSSAVSAATAFTVASMVVTAPRSGTMMLRARGHCRLDTLTTEAHGVNVGLFLAGETSVLFVHTAGVHVPPHPTTGAFHLSGFAAERPLSVTAGTTYQVQIREYHSSGASAPAFCTGTASAMLFTGVLP